MKPARWNYPALCVGLMMLLVVGLYGYNNLTDLKALLTSLFFGSSLEQPLGTVALAKLTAYFLVVLSLVTACVIFIPHARNPVAAVTAVRPRWAFILPAGALVVVSLFFGLGPFRDEADTSSLSLVISTVFGLASVLGLALSGIVLLNIHKVITKETQLVEEAATLLNNTRKTLTFISLSPNLGYAACIKDADEGRIKRFREALCNALDRLANERDAEVKMAYLSRLDIERLYDVKAAALRGRGGFLGENGETTYKMLSDTLQKEVEKRFDEKRVEGYASNRFTLKRFRPCLTVTTDNKKSADQLTISEPTSFPPLGMLIADGKKAILLGNVSLLNAEPTPLTGYMAESPEQVRGIMLLSDSYYSMYTQEEKPRGARLAAEATALLKSAKRKLIFVSLSPNLGYAACIRSDSEELIEQFHEALCGALDRLGREQDEQTDVKMAYLDDDDIKAFYGIKGAALRGWALSGGKDGEYSYTVRSTALQDEVEKLFKRYASNRFTLKRFRPCLTVTTDRDSGEISAINGGNGFPPIGMLIVDGEKAILLWLYALLTPDAKVVTYTADGSGEAIAIRAFAESYDYA